MVPVEGFKGGQGPRVQEKCGENWACSAWQRGECNGLTAACNYLKGCSKDAARHFLVASADTTSNDGHKPAESQLRHLHLLNSDGTLGKTLPQKWHAVVAQAHRKMINLPSPKVFKTCVEKLMADSPKCWQQPCSKQDVSNLCPPTVPWSWDGFHYAVHHSNSMCIAHLQLPELPGVHFWKHRRWCSACMFSISL